MLNDKVRKKVEEIRKENGYTQLEMAKLIGYKSAKAYYEIESGRREFRLHQIDKLIKKFKKPISYFFGSIDTKSA